MRQEFRGSNLEEDSAFGCPEASVLDRTLIYGFVNGILIAVECYDPQFHSIIYSLLENTVKMGVCAGS